jgi:hypothetical protein
MKSTICSSFNRNTLKLTSKSVPTTTLSAVSIPRACKFNDVACRCQRIAIIYFPVQVINSSPSIVVKTFSVNSWMKSFLTSNFYQFTPNPCSSHNVPSSNSAAIHLHCIIISLSPLGLLQHLPVLTCGVPIDSNASAIIARPKLFLSRKNCYSNIRLAIQQIHHIQLRFSILITSLLCVVHTHRALGDAHSERSLEICPHNGTSLKDVPVLRDIPRLNMAMKRDRIKGEATRGYAQQEILLPVPEWARRDPRET